MHVVDTALLSNLIPPHLYKLILIMVRQFSVGIGEI